MHSPRFLVEMPNLFIVLYEQVVLLKLPGSVKWMLHNQPNACTKWLIEFVSLNEMESVANICDVFWFADQAIFESAHTDIIC